MCRLFGFQSGSHPIHANYWLLAAPDSMSSEGERNPDGTGIGWFTKSGQPRMDKQAEAADVDRSFAQDACRIDTNLMVSHVRMTLLPKSRMTGLGADHLVEDTHPFMMKGRLMAHNGGFGDLTAVEDHLGDYLHLVHGHTDSERFMALVTKETDAHHGDVGAGITAAATWLSKNVPMYSLNCILIDNDNLWALRYPDQRSLHVATRMLRPEPRDDTGKHFSWLGESSWAGHRLTSDKPVETVLVASERIDATADWRLLEPGELLHVGPDLQTTSTIALSEPPTHLSLPTERDPNDDAD
jgi:predicted glutamine amidotransferase